MNILFRNYSGEPLHGDDYIKVREFLIRINEKRLTTPNFDWARWEWMITHFELDRKALGKIGLWEHEGKLVALVTYETALGDAYFCVDENYALLKPEMLDHAVNSLHSNGTLRLMIADNDREMQRLAAARGFRATQNREYVSALDISEKLSYSLPEGFKIISMADGWDWEYYNNVMWRGFHPGEGEAPQTQEVIESRRKMLSSPVLNPRLVLAVTAPGGAYVAHCGMWYIEGHDTAYIEPVATDPDFRARGLGKAAVLEACIRCGRLGAKRALVCSSKQFYYSIGFYPIHTETWWSK